MTIVDIVKRAERTWRKVASLATPIDATRPVIIGSNPKSRADFEAYTDNEKIYININDEKKFRKNFDNIIVPAYDGHAEREYGLSHIPLSELSDNLIFDTFLFVHFHEQLHPWLCPNSRYDEKTISKALYDGIRAAEPSLPKSSALLKVNNCKNLMWDVVLNVSFLHKTDHAAGDVLEEKISTVFEDDKRSIDSELVTRYPSGILPIVYAISAQNRTTDSAISLIGLFYTTLSYASEVIRKRVADIFFDDLKSKKVNKTDVEDCVQKMYAGFVDELSDADLARVGINKKQFVGKIATRIDLSHKDYEKDQRYFRDVLTKIFDTPALRYASLRGFTKVLSKYISLNEKQGSPDQNTTSYGSGDGDASDDAEGDSLGQTLDDILDTVGDNEADDILQEIGQGNGAGGSGKNPLKKIEIVAIDEYYKKHAEIIEVKNPREDTVSIAVGTKKLWKLVRSDRITAEQVARLSYQKILAFQRATGLPVLMEIGQGFYRLNEYKLVETPLKSYTHQKSGIEVPDNWVFFQDSSGSMTGQVYVGSGNKFDLLNRVKYGLMKGLYQVCKSLDKDLLFGVVDFSNVTHYSGLDSLVKIYEARNHRVKEVSLTPQCGGTSIDSKVFAKVAKELAPGKTIYTFITDGEIDGDTNALYNAIEKFVSDPQHAFVFVEVQSHSSFGGQIKALAKKNDAVLYYAVNDIKSIKNKLSSVLIRYG